jgi:hypothetical protein
VHGIVRISVVALILIAVIAGQARSSTPEPATNGGTSSPPSPEMQLSPAENDRRTANTSLLTASVQIVLFVVDTFLDMHGQDATDDRNAALDNSRDNSSSD